MRLPNPIPMFVRYSMRASRKYRQKLALQGMFRCMQESLLALWQSIERPTTQLDEYRTTKFSPSSTMANEAAELFKGMDVEFSCVPQKSEPLRQFINEHHRFISKTSHD
jgi:hypothetical protein